MVPWDQVEEHMHLETKELLKSPEEKMEDLEKEAAILRARKERVRHGAFSGRGKRTAENNGAVLPETGNAAEICLWQIQDPTGGNTRRYIGDRKRN